MCGRRWSKAHIHRSIRRSGYSCIKVFLWAAEIDQIERLDYQLRLYELCISPEMLVCIDKTAWMRLNGIRDRIWARTGDLTGSVLYCFFGTRNSDTLCQ